MKNKTMIAGVLVGVLGAGLLLMFVAQAGGAAEDGASTSAYLVTEDLEPGMTPAEVRERVEAGEVPGRLAPERRVTDLADLEGQEVVRRVGSGEILSADQFSPPGPAATGQGVVVPSGYEAITVEAEPAPGVEGYVSPGSRVNVYATFAQGAPAGGEPAAAEGDGAYTQLVLGHLDVLATTPASSTGDGEQAAGSPQGGMVDGKVVLLLQVRPEDAPVLIHASQQAQLWYTLVNPDDEAATPTRVQNGDFDPGARAAEIDAARTRQDETAARDNDNTGGNDTDGEGTE